MHHAFTEECIECLTRHRTDNQQAAQHQFPTRRLDRLSRHIDDQNPCHCQRPQGFCANPLRQPIWSFMNRTAATAIAAGLRLITTVPTAPFTRCIPVSRKMVNATILTPPMIVISIQSLFEIFGKRRKQLLLLAFPCRKVPSLRKASHKQLLVAEVLF